MKVFKDIGFCWEKLIQNSLDIIGAIDQHGIITNVNKACKSILGYESKEMVGSHFIDFIHPEDVTKTLEVVQDAVKGNKVKNFENRYIHRNGQEVSMSWSGAWSAEDEVMLCIGREITGQKLAQQKSELYKNLVESRSDMISMFDKDLNYLYSGPSVLKELGYLPEQLIGNNAMDYVHPEDIPMIQASLSKGLASGEENIKVSEFRFKNAKGEWRWMESIGSNQLQNPAIKALVVNSRDITERINNQLMLQESEQRFKSLFEHHLDMVFFMDKDGVIIDVNAATLSYLAVQKQDVVKRRFPDLFSPETISHFNQAFQKALNGESVRFEIDIPFEGKGICTFDIANIPVIVNGETIGVYNILRDVNEISRSNKIIRRQAKKLNTIFESITNGFFTLDKNWNFTYINNECERLLSIRRENIVGRNIWSMFPEAVNGVFYRQYHNAVKTGKAVHFNAFYEPLDIWVHAKVFPSREGLSVYFDDVTEQVKAKQELEKLSLVASKTTNGVVISNAEGQVEWVNDGFERLTGYTLPEVIGKKTNSFLYGEKTNKATVQLLEENLKRGKPFTGEILKYKKSGEKVWILLNITPVVNEVGKVINFTSIQTDITERKEAEKNQHQLTKDLYRQNTDLQQFTYIVSHNLRSPVANIIGLADFLTTTEDKGSETYEVSLGYLKKTTQQLDTVLKDLNHILSIRDKKAACIKEKVELAPVIQQVLGTLQESLNECGGKVFMNIEAGVSVNGNKGYIYSIFHNLLSNSIKYRSTDRQLEIYIKCVDSADSGTVISFSDNGIGFDVEKAGDNVFKLYKRFHTNFEGRGIGLFLVKTHVEAMNGHIEVNSCPNAGTSFLINLK